MFAFKVHFSARISRDSLLLLFRKLEVVAQQYCSGCACLESHTNTVRPPNGGCMKITPSNMLRLWSSALANAMKLSAGLHAHGRTRPSTVNRSLCRLQRESCWCSGAVHLAEVSGGCLWRKKTNPDLLPCERLPASQPAASGRLSSHSGPSDQDVWVRKWLATPSAPFSNCPKGNYLVSFPLKTNQKL